MNNRVLVSWYCSMYVGEPYWHGTEIYEPDECGTSFETDELIVDFEDQSCYARCPKCGSILWQVDDSCELVNYD